MFFWEVRGWIIFFILFIKVVRLKRVKFKVRLLFLSFEKFRMLFINDERRLLFLVMVFIMECWFFVKFDCDKIELRVMRVCMGVCILWFIIVRKLLCVVIVFFVFFFVIFRVRFWVINWFCVCMDFFNIVVCESVIVIWLIWIRFNSKSEVNICVVKRNK